MLEIQDRIKDLLYEGSSFFHEKTDEVLETIKNIIQFCPRPPHLPLPFPSLFTNPSHESSIGRGGVPFQEETHRGDPAGTPKEVILFLLFPDSQEEQPQNSTGT